MGMIFAFLAGVLLGGILGIVTAARIIANGRDDE